jgi:hypothetical protein
MKSSRIGGIGLGRFCKLLRHLSLRISQNHVSLPDTHARSDADLAKAVANALSWDVEVPHSNIKATVRDGVVTLEGTVDWAYQRLAAEGALRYLAGVKRLRDLIAVSPSPATSVDVKQHIKAALTRSAEADAARINS